MSSPAMLWPRTTNESSWYLIAYTITRGEDLPPRDAPGHAAPLLIAASMPNLFFLNFFILK